MSATLQPTNIKVDDLDINKIQSAVDSVINEKYPQLSKRMVYPLRKKQLYIYQSTYGKLLRHFQNQNEDKLKNDEKNELTKFYDEQANYGKGRMQQHTVINPNTKVPEDIKNALIALKIYQNIPIINNRLYSDFTVLENWKKGQLKPLNRLRLKTIVLNRNPTLKDELKKFPEYRLLLAFIRGKYYEVRKKLYVEQNKLQDPRRFSKRIFKKVLEKLPYAPKKSEPSTKYIRGQDAEVIRQMETNKPVIREYKQNNEADSFYEDLVKKGNLAWQDIKTKGKDYLLDIAGSYLTQRFGDKMGGLGKDILNKFK